MGLVLQGITVRQEKISMTQDQAIEQAVADEIPMKVLFANPVLGKVQMWLCVRSSLIAKKCKTCIFEWKLKK